MTHVRIGLTVMRCMGSGSGLRRPEPASGERNVNGTVVIIPIPGLLRRDHAWYSGGVCVITSGGVLRLGMMQRHIAQ